MEQAQGTLWHNPLKEATRDARVINPCIFVIFGATGDLTARKLLPALYNLAREGQLPLNFACVGFARRDKTHEQFRNEMKEAVTKYSRIKPEEETWNEFCKHLFYHVSEFHDDNGYISLHKFLAELDGQFNTKGNRLFYLSTQPSFFTLIIQKLYEYQLTYQPTEDKWSRVIIEKPFGEDLSSALELQTQITKHLDESQIYRIDHYLGKETVQNILVFRFGNTIFESVWNSHHIDHIQITVSEEIGIGTRGHFFEEAGMLRDIVQNHMMQLLSLIAMEPPISLSASAIHDEKVKVLESIRPINRIQENVVRGQYDTGYINGQEACAYRSEQNVNPDSSVETYVALQLFIDNWRWAGVPFYLRAGKRLPKRATEIAIIFRPAPGYLLKSNGNKTDTNTLVIRIQPDEGISLKMNCKVPGLNTQIQPVKMDFRYGSFFGMAPPEAYERLICDCMAGDKTLYAGFDEVVASWRLLSPILEFWKTNTVAFPNYAAGTWGPAEADALLAKSGRQWRLL